MYYNDPAYTTAIGIDVSSHQKEIDWQKVADSGVEFAMIRLGYRGYGSEGTLNMDPYFQQNLIGATAAGLKIGVYFYSQAITAAEAAEEARFVLDALGGFPLTYPSESQLPVFLLLNSKNI
jgi:GH25 family lysozyme M1 (1,4-beta-N-acetylmuramidase)